MRGSENCFFNEIDTFAQIKGLDSKSIINGSSLDPRIGNCYNNPYFSYGGYCLPKDTLQLREDCKSLPVKLIQEISTANDIRKSFISR